eukprot:12897659-Prorocentrum_lima.AAC.1
MNPRYWLRGSDCVNFNPYSDIKAVQYDNICQFMHYCHYSNESRIFDDVFELCGGTTNVPVIMIRRRHTRLAPISTQWSE